MGIQCSLVALNKYAVRKYSSPLIPVRVLICVKTGSRPLRYVHLPLLIVMKERRHVNAALDLGSPIQRLNLF